jgi:hypothetical protein
MDPIPKGSLSLLEFLFLTASAAVRHVSYAAHRAPMQGGLMEAIHTTAMAHPEWPPLSSTRTWEQWSEWRESLPSRH